MTLGNFDSLMKFRPIAPQLLSFRIATKKIAYISGRQSDVVNDDVVGNLLVVEGRRSRIGQAESDSLDLLYSYT